MPLGHCDKGTLSPDQAIERNLKSLQKLGKNCQYPVNPGHGMIYGSRSVVLELVDT